MERRRGFRHPVRGKQPPVKDGERPAYLQGALVAMDPATGYVRAMVGGRDFGESSFNRAVQAKRQSGSAFKPFVYAAALEAGYSPGSVITRLNEPIETPQGGWLPEDEHSSASSMTLRTALRTSSNRAAVQLLNTVGIPQAVGYAQKLNVGTPPSVPSLALGASDVTLISLTAAYGAFANGGTVRQPVLIRRVEDSDGTVLYADQSTAHRAVSESTAFLMSSMLADVINSGTAYRARQAGFTLPAAGKTGTTNGYVDAWFVGFTPHLVTGVWIGFDQPSTIVANGYAGELAVPLWASFMKVATKGDKPDWIARPSNVVGINVCRVSGKLPNAGCTSVDVIEPRGGHRNAVDGLHRILHVRERSRRRCARCTPRRRSWIGSPGCSEAVLPKSRSAQTRQAFRRTAPARAGRPHVPLPSPMRAPEDPKSEAEGRGGAEETRLLGPALRPRRQEGRAEARRTEEARRRSTSSTRNASAASRPERPVSPSRAATLAFCSPELPRRTRPDMIGFLRPPHAIPQHHRASATARADGPGIDSRDTAAEPDLRGARRGGQAHGRGRPRAAGELPRRPWRCPVRDAWAKDSCGECAACKRIARGVHADVVVVEPGETGSIKIEQIRDAIEGTGYRPFEGRRRVVIIDGADAIVTQGQDALLKTLEEPAAASSFVLVTSRPDVLLPTVRSRCQCLRFGRLSPADVAAVLVREHQYTEADAHAAAALSDGSIGLAIEGGTEAFVDAREAAAGLLERVAASDDPRRRLEGAKALTASGGGTQRSGRTGAPAARAVVDSP